MVHNISNGKILIINELEYSLYLIESNIVPLHDYGNKIEWMNDQIYEYEYNDVTENEGVRWKKL